MNPHSIQVVYHEAIFLERLKVHGFGAVSEALLVGLDFPQQGFVNVPIHSDGLQGLRRYSLRQWYQFPPVQVDRAAFVIFFGVFDVVVK